MENFPKMFFPKIVSNFFQTSIIKIDGKFVVNKFMTDFYFEYWLCRSGSGPVFAKKSGFYQ